MYKIKEFKSVVRIAPDLFNTQRREAIANELNNKLANKVVANVGLCIALYDIVRIGDSYIIPGDGSAHVKVTFRYIVFRPPIDTVIYGKVKLCDSEGIHISLTFFDDILIPQQHMPDFSSFNPVQSTWVWKYKQSADSEPHDMPTEKGDLIRFKVAEDEFTDTTPTPSDQNQGAAADASKSKPYRIIGKTSESGLGLPSWWQGSEAGEEEEEEEADGEEEEEEEGEGEEGGTED